MYSDSTISNLLINSLPRQCGIFKKLSKATLESKTKEEQEYKDNRHYIPKLWNTLKPYWEKKLKLYIQISNHKTKQKKKLKQSSKKFEKKRQQNEYQKCRNKNLITVQTESGELEKNLKWYNY